MHIKKIKSIAMVSIMIAISSMGYNVEAYQNNTEIVDKTDIVGEVYEKEKTTSVKQYSLSTNSDMSKEVEDDLSSLYDIKYLKLKTESKYEIALAYENGDYTYLDSADNIDSAIEIANNMQNKVKSNIIPVIINEDGLVVYATDAIGKIVKIIDGKPVVDGDSNYKSYTTNIYKTETASSRFTYINHAYIDDAPIIENNGKRSKIQVNGITGWIDNEDDEGVNIIAVPLNQVKNLSYFTKDNNDTLNHYISFDIQNTGKGNNRGIGVAPSFMEVGKKYYSYDGKYFYTNITDLLQDLESNTNTRSINKYDPYYNYYAYIPARHKSVYSVNEINDYIANNTQADSVLRNKGQAFLTAQDKYGVSANFILGIAMNESGRGTSDLAKEKNNIFGLNAIDKTPGESANYYPSIEACVEDFAKNWMHNDYLNPKSWKYNGSNLGNKYAGINVMYASDPYWGEKAADFMHRMDKYISGDGKLIDYNRYQLGVYTKTDAVKDSNNNTLYTVLSNRSQGSQIGDSLIILNESNEKTQLYPDRLVPIIQENPRIYDWNKKAYVNSDSVEFINEKDEMLREFKNFTISNANITSTSISGKGISGATVKAYVNGKQIGNTATVNADDNYKINIPRQSNGVKITLEISKFGYKTAKKTITVKNIFESFSVNSLTTKSKELTGKGMSGATVKSYVGSKQVGNTTIVDSKGNYKITIPEQRSGTTITVTMSKDGYESKSKYTTVISTISNIRNTLTKDIYRYDLGANNHLTYINGRGYSQYSYLNRSGNYAFTPSSWMKAAGLSITMPTSTNGYMMTINNNYIEMYKDAESLLSKIKLNKISSQEALADLTRINAKSNEVTDQLAVYSSEVLEINKSTVKSNLTNDIYRYDAGEGRYLTYINGRGYSQYSYLNRSGNYAFTPSSWMKAAGLEITMPTMANGYTMKIDNPYINKYNNVVKEIQNYL